jgi:hypothetical protein
MKKATVFLAILLIAAAITMTACTDTDQSAAPDASQPAVLPSASAVSDAPASSLSPAAENAALQSPAASDVSSKDNGQVQNILDMINDAKGELQEEPAPDISTD